jgi:hypothetical protein
MRKNSIALLFLLVAAPFSFLFGQDSTKSTGVLTISGYVDVYYTYNFNHPRFAAPNPLGLPQPNGFGYQNQGRIFDIKHNQFSLGLAQTKFAYTKGKLTGVVDLTFGPNAELGNFGNIFGSMISIKQAYMDYNFTPKLRFTIGQFGTHVGYELIDAPLNFNYSLSYLFGNGPFYHTGAKLAYSFSDKAGIMVGVVNGWDNMFAWNKKKSAIAQVYLAPVSGLNIYLNYVGGDQKNGLSFPTLGSPYPGAQLPDSIKTPTHLFDLTSTFQVTEAFKIGVNAAYGFGRLKPNSVDSSKYDWKDWYGAALYLNYSFSDKFALGLRAEHFSDKNGVRYVTASTGIAGTYNEFTLTGDIKLEDGMFNIKPEFRIDVAGQKSFNQYSSESDKATVKLSKVQPTAGIAFIFKY